MVVRGSIRLRPRHARYRGDSHLAVRRSGPVPFRTSDGSREFTFVGEPVQEISWREWFSRGTRVDGAGRVWRVEDVDQEALEAALEGPVTETRVEGNEEEAGMEVTWVPTSWQHFDCDGEGPDEVRIWDGDDRVLVACADSCDDDGPLYDSDCCGGETDEEEMLPSGRQAAAVRIEINGSPKCSGVLVRNLFALTAAHCVANDDNTAVPVGSVRVCRWDDDELCNPVASGGISFMDSHGGGSGDGGGTDFDDDWAIIELRDAWTDIGMTSPETMNLSNQSDAELASIGKVYNLPNPGDVMAPGCNGAGGNMLYSLLEDEPIAGILTDHLRLKIDGGPGASGSPFYSCPDGVSWFCGAGETGVVFGVEAGYNTANDRMVGPKVPHDRDAMLAFIND